MSDDPTHRRYDLRSSPTTAYSKDVVSANGEAGAGWLGRFAGSFSGHARPLVMAVLYGLAGAAAALGFRFAVSAVYDNGIAPLAAMQPLHMLLVSFAVVMSTSLISGILVTRYCPEAAGSGIPQVKAAFWQKGGFVPLRLLVVKFCAGALSIGGGASLGREGPSVQLAGAAATNLAGAAGAAPDDRRAALAAGAASGLAAAFNTPISAITFVLEEVIEDLNNAAYLSQALLAAVVATLVTHMVVGAAPAFIIPAVDDFSPRVYLAAPLVGAVAAAVGVLFQVLTLEWRDWIRKKSKVPAWLRPAVGGFFTWTLGVSVLLSVGHLGVFSLGYGDLEETLHGNMPWQIALLLLGAKLLATAAAYSWGGCGGIFAPVLFLGASAGMTCAGLLDMWIPLSKSDTIVLVVVGMSTCLGAVVRAPITSMLIVFEMTHHFAIVPVLMLGTMVSQAVARRLVKENFYTDVLARDGIHVDKMIPPRSLADWHMRHAATVANLRPELVTSLAPDALRAVLERSHHQYYPLMREGTCIGILPRAEARRLADAAPALGETASPPPEPALLPAVTIHADATIREAGILLLKSPSGMLVMLDYGTSTRFAGVITLHDLVHGEIRAADGLPAREGS